MSLEPSINETNMDDSNDAFATMFPYGTLGETNSIENNANDANGMTVQQHDAFEDENATFFDAHTDFLDEQEELPHEGDNDMSNIPESAMINPDDEFLGSLGEDTNNTNEHDTDNSGQQTFDELMRSIEQGDFTNQQGDSNHQQDESIRETSVYAFHADDHEEKCNEDRGFTSPPPLAHVDPDAPAKSFEEDEPTNLEKAFGVDQLPINPEKHLSRDYKTFRDFHIRAKECIPRIYLEQHRYWIGIVELDRKVANATKEKDFTWMKGNRVTTVNTVLHAHPAFIMIPRLVLLHWGNRVDLSTTMEELNDFNDKVIFFRVLRDTDLGAGGREIGWDWLPKEHLELSKEKPGNKSEPMVIDVDSD